MSRQSPLLFLSLLLLALPLLACAAKKSPLVNGWTPINNVNDLHVVEIGKYSVEEHNKHAKTNLKFVKIVSGQEQVVSGMNYKLIVAVKDPKDKVGGLMTFEAVVWEQGWANFKQLTSFKRLLKG